MTILIKTPLDLKKLLENYVIYSVEDFEHLLEPIWMLKNATSLEYFESFRGQALDTWHLEPQLTRTSKDIEVIKLIEKDLHAHFKSLQSTKHNVHLSGKKTSGFGTHFEIEWFELFQMQHLGYQTRMLDWTISWEAALYFAVSNPNHDGKDGQFWIFYYKRDMTHNFMENLQQAPPRYLNINPYDVKNTMFINAPFYVEDGENIVLGEKRRFAQSGRFLIQNHADSVLPMELQPQISDLLIKLNINGNSKAGIRNELEKRGVNSQRIYYKQVEELNNEIKKINIEIIGKYK